MTKAIKKADKMELSTEDSKRLFNPAVSGMDENLEGGRMDYPRMLKVLQSDKQWKWFEKGMISPEDYGKLFFNKGEGGGVHDDLMDSITGTILRIEQGAMIFTDDTKSSVVSRRAKIIGTQQKDEWLKKNSPYIYQNQNRITLSLKSAEETYEMLRSRSEGDLKVEMPLVVVTLKGTSFGQVFEVWKQMDALMKNSDAYKDRTVQEQSHVLKSLFTLTVRTKKEVSEENREYYSMSCEVKLNNPAEALGFERLVQELDEFPYFRQARDSQNGTEEPKGSNSTPYDESGESEQSGAVGDAQKEKVVDMGEVDVKDLPF